MVVLTDGANNYGEPAVLTSADAAKSAGIRVITIGLGTEIVESTLTNAASSLKDYFKAPTPDQLAAKYAEIAENLCRLTFSSPVISAVRTKSFICPGLPRWMAA
jgi:hypothetical protein